jgi:hypothetical protein
VGTSSWKGARLGMHSASSPRPTMPFSFDSSPPRPTSKSTLSREPRGTDMASRLWVVGLAITVSVVDAGCGNAPAASGLAIVCPDGRADCDGDQKNGCEGALGSVEHCGGCNNACPVVPPSAHALISCNPSVGCQIACRLSYKDTDGVSENGCEEGGFVAYSLFGPVEPDCPTDPSKVREYTECDDSVLTTSCHYAKPGTPCWIALTCTADLTGTTFGASWRVGESCLGRLGRWPCDVDAECGEFRCLNNMCTGTPGRHGGCLRSDCGADAAHNCGCSFGQICEGNWDCASEICNLDADGNGVCGTASLGG